MRRRRLLAITGATVFAGCSGGETTAGTDTAGRDVTGTAADPDAGGATESDGTPTDTAESEYDLFGPDARMYSGTGDDVIEDITLQDGMTATKVNHEGDGTFKVAFEPQEDGYTQILVDSSGRYDSIEASLESGGPYNIDITASGQWGLTLSEPRPETGASVPVSFDGTGNAVVGPIERDGAVRVVGSHDGDGEFGTYALPPANRIGTEIFDRQGPADDAETTVELYGVYFVDVQATGDWSLEFTPS